MQTLATPEPAELTFYRPLWIPLLEVLVSGGVCIWIVYGWIHGFDCAALASSRYLPTCKWIEPLSPVVFAVMILLVSAELGHFFHRRAALVVNDRGLVIGYPSVVQVRWSEFEDAVAAAPPSKVIHIKVKDEPAVLRRFRTAETAGGRLLGWTRFLFSGGNPLAIKTVGFGCRRQWLAEEIRRRAAGHLQGPRPDAS